MGFFVASRGPDGSADLGGLAGADAHCQRLATAAGAGHRRWRAYLSTAGTANTPPIHARNRIGPGPWHNAAGVLIARDLDELHSDRHAIDARTALDERGRRPAERAHDVLTGSDASGHLAYFAGRPATCGDWTRDGEGVAIIGHDDRMDASSHDNPRFVHWNGSWNAEHETTGCSAAHLAETGGGGAFYCFAADPGPASASPPADAASYGFRRGVNLNHWLADNLAPEQLPNAHYGADWFAEDDVAWIAARGFDHLRIWVDGAAWLDAEGHLDEAAIARFDDALRWSAAHGLGVVLAMYGLPGHRAGIRGAPQPDATSPFTDAATRGDAAYLWWAIAHRYRDVGDRLRFELLVRPEAEDAAQLRAFHAATLDAVRRVDPRRIVYLTPREGRLELADEVLFPDPHTMLAADFTEPEIFTHQFGMDGELDVAFPGRLPALEARRDALPPTWLRYGNTEWTEASLDALLTDQLHRARRHAGRHGVYLGWIGALAGADDDSVRRYLRVVRATTERNDAGWAVYDYHAGGAVRAQLGTGEATRVIEGLGIDAALGEG